MCLWTGRLLHQLLHSMWLRQPLTSPSQLLCLAPEMIVFLFVHQDVEVLQHLFVTLRAVEL